MKDSLKDTKKRRRTEKKNTHVGNAEEASVPKIDEIQEHSPITSKKRGIENIRINLNSEDKEDKDRAKTTQEYILMIRSTEEEIIIKGLEGIFESITSQ